MIVFVVVFGGSALLILAVAGPATGGNESARRGFLSTYMIASAFNGIAASFGFLPAWLLLLRRPSLMSVQRPSLWPLVSGGVSLLALNTGITSGLIGGFFGHLLPPAHYGMTDLFASVAAMSFAVTLCLKFVDGWFHASEGRSRRQSA